MELDKSDVRATEAGFAGAHGSADATPRFRKAYLECLDDTGAITRLEPLYNFAKRMELENRALREGCSKIAASYCADLRRQIQRATAHPTSD